MTEETMPASAPAAQHTQPADNAPAQDYEQPAATPERWLSSDALTTHD